MVSTFKDYLRQLRIESAISLRELAIAAQVDPSNLSKYERGVLPAPGEDVVRKIAKGLGLPIKGSAYRRLLDLSLAENGAWPRDILDSQIIAALPAFYQHLRAQGVERDKAGTVENLAKALRKEFQS